MMVNPPPASVWLAPHVPQSRQGERLPTLEMNPHGYLAFSLFAPFVKPVSRDDATATADEMLECRLLRQGFGTGVNHPVSD